MRASFFQNIFLNACTIFSDYLVLIAFRSSLDNSSKHGISFIDIVVILIGGSRHAEKSRSIRIVRAALNMAERSALWRGEHEASRFPVPCRPMVPLAAAIPLYVRAIFAADPPPGWCSDEATPWRSVSNAYRYPRITSRLTRQRWSRWILGVVNTRFNHPTTEHAIWYFAETRLRVSPPSFSRTWFVLSFLSGSWYPTASENFEFFLFLLSAFFRTIGTAAALTAPGTVGKTICSHRLPLHHLSWLRSLLERHSFLPFSCLSRFSLHVGTWYTHATIRDAKDEYVFYTDCI